MLEPIISTGNTKMGKVHNLSLPPITTCHNSNCARKCYAMKAFRMFKNTKEAWLNNLRAYREDPYKFFDDVTAYIKKNKVSYFRWHVGGDIPDREYYMGLCLVASRCPETRFMVFTKYTEVVPLSRPDNLRVVASAWPNTNLDVSLKDHRIELNNWYNIVKNHAPIAWMVPGKGDKSYATRAYNELRKKASRKAKACSGRCDECFLCWDLGKKDGVVFEEH